MTDQFFDRADGKKAGVALWRQIADALRLDIAAGRFQPGTQLPGEIALAERFGVNRHTVRSAFAALQQDGVVEARQGRGTFVLDNKRIAYRISRRTRFSEGLAGQASNIDRKLLSSVIEPASATIAKLLDLAPGTPLSRRESVSSADGKPLSRATSWLEAARFPDLDERYGELGSITEVFRQYGLTDYVRAQTRISARHADTEEAQSLKLAPGAIVLVSEGLDTEVNGKPLQYVLSRFAAERVDLMVGEAV